MCLSASQHRKYIANSIHLDTLEGFDNRHRRVLKRAHTKQDGKCYWCDRETHLWWELTTEEWITIGKQKMATREHMIPKSEGGLHTDINITCACYRCNTLRGTISVDQFKWVTSTSKRLKRLLQIKAEKKAERNRIKKEKQENHKTLMARHTNNRQHKLELRARSAEDTENYKLIKFAKHMNWERHNATDIMRFVRPRNEQQQLNLHNGIIKFARRMRFEHHNTIRNHRAFAVVLLNYMIWRYPPCQELITKCQPKVETLNLGVKVRKFFAKVNLMKGFLKRAPRFYALQSQTSTTGGTFK